MLAAALFWAICDKPAPSQSFADRYTVRHIDVLSWEIPTAWFQAVGPVFIIIFAAGCRMVAGRPASVEPPLPIKFGLGLILLAVGFPGSRLRPPNWSPRATSNPAPLISTYLVHTFGELCLSPVGLSSLRPGSPLPRRADDGHVVPRGLPGNLIAGLVAGEFKAEAVGHARLDLTTMTRIRPELALILLAKPIRKWMAGVN